MATYKKFDPSKECISLLLKGVSGTGKTTVAAQFPKPCLIEFDKNVSCLRKLPAEEVDEVKIFDPLTYPDGKPVEPTKIWDYFIKNLVEIAKDPEVKTIVIDTLTTALSALSNSILGTSSPKEQFKIQDWGTFGRYLAWLGDNLIQVKGKDKHIVVVCHENTEIDKDGNFHGWTLAIGGQMRRNFELYFSDVWQCTVSQTGEYLINTKPNKWVTAKCSLDIPKNPFPFNEYKDLIMKQLAD